MTVDHQQRTLRGGIRSKELDAISEFLRYILDRLEPVSEPLGAFSRALAHNRCAGAR